MKVSSRGMKFRGKCNSCHGTGATDLKKITERLELIRRYFKELDPEFFDEVLLQLANVEEKLRDENYIRPQK